MSYFAPLVGVSRLQLQLQLQDPAAARLIFVVVAALDAEGSHCNVEWVARRNTGTGFSGNGN